ncbi:MAG: ABC transporter permease [Deltaproteobacteria bacterium]
MRWVKAATSAEAIACLAVRLHCWPEPDESGGMRLGPTLHDVRFGLRLWRRNPAFFGLVLVVLVLGVGTTTAMFSLLQALLWRPLPYPEPEQLLELSARRATGTGSPISVQDFVDWQTRSQTLSRVSIAHNWLFALASEGLPPEGVVGAQVSGGFFPMLGLRPLLGRLLGPEDDRVGAPPAAVLSAEVWQQRFGSDPAVIGRSIRLDGQPHTVIGIAPRGFGFSYPGNERSYVWTPMSVSGAFAWFASSHSIREWHGLGRRTANASLSEVEAELSQISATAEADGQSERIGVSARDLHAAIMGESDSSLWVRLAAVGMVFLVVCSNVSNLLFVRAEARRAELTMRAAFGATRLRLVRQLLTETLLCFLVAAPLSALSARWLVDLLRALSFEQYSELQQLELPVDARAWAFCFGACVIAGLGSGLLPALVVSRVDLLAVLKQSGAGASTGKAAAGLRGVLVGVVAAALIGRVLANQIPGTPSFDLRVCLVVAVTLVGAGTLAAWVPARRALRVPPGAALRYD